jgi:hypothetical protein
MPSVLWLIVGVALMAGAFLLGLIVGLGRGYEYGRADAFRFDAR